MTLLLAAAFAGLGYRLVDLQVVHHEALTREARALTHHAYQIAPRRGDILDRSGNLLATSVLVKTVCANPSLVGGHSTEVARVLAPLLQMKEGELAQRLAPTIHLNEKGAGVTNAYVVLKRKVATEVWERIRAAMDELSFGLDEKRLPKKEQAFYRNLREHGIFAEDGQLRTYPFQNLAAHVLGYVGTVERATDGIQSEETAGMDGIERTLNAKLSGTRGLRVTEQDRQKHELVAFRQEDLEARDGLNVVLTIDSVVQHIVETALAGAMRTENPVSIASLVIRPRTGEILAWAVLPNFDPNSPGALEDARRNRVIADIAEPGSTFKIVVVSGALNDRLVTLTDEFNCEEGTFTFAGRKLHDHKPYGILPVEGIITKSSNIGAAKIGIKMGAARLYEYIRNFGFGVQTGIFLPGEVRGQVHPPKEWSKVSIAQIPMGQGVAVTSLQMAMAMCAIANKGVLMRPMLVDRLEDENGNIVARYAPEQVRRVISEEADKQIIQALKTVVSTNGTGPKAALEHYTVAGKTGTAQKVPYTSKKFYASFIGFFPADDPEICIYVSLDDPKGDLHQGGQIAAPTFKEIAEKTANYLNIRPDKDTEPFRPLAEAAANPDLSVKTAQAHSP